MWRWLGMAAVVWATLPVSAQIDPVKRELLQLGYNQPLEGSAPIAAYAFYYYNRPDFLDHTNLTLRLAVAPVYLDSELGISHILGETTDLGIGLAGGGFAESYYEIRQGKYYQEESFTGNGGQVSSSLYHLFNPDQRIPLNGMLRGEVAEALFERDEQTAANFVVPVDRTTLRLRTGLRYGGKEPLLAPALAMELSAWYEGELRLQSGPYGYNGDRDVRPSSHLFWGRALLAYTTKRKDNFMVSVTGGASADVDRFSAYRLGGVLPLASEFPLSIPGYFYQELSASRFVLFNGVYYLPLTTSKRWEFTAEGASAWVDYAPGLQQPNHWNSGLGGGLTYHASSGAWLISLQYGYGFDAIRSHGDGGQSIGFLVEFDLERTKEPFTTQNPYSPNWFRGVDSILRSFQ